MASRLSRVPVRVGNQRLVGSADALGEPGFEHCSDRRRERRSSCLSSFAGGVDVGAGGQRDVLAVERDQLGDPQPGLDREGKHRVVAPAGPGGLVAGQEQRVDFGVGEVGQEVALGAFGWDREHAPDRVGVFWVVQREVGEQRVDRREPVVAGRDHVVASVFEVVEERGDQRRVEIGDVQGARRLAGAFGGEAEQQPEGVAVGGDRVRTRAALTDQPVGEVGLHRRRERGHGRPPRCRWSRWQALSISSGVAVRYQ